MCRELVQATDQSDVIAAMSCGSFYPHAAAEVERIETHAAIVFLAGDHVYKIKKAVRYPYIDLSTLEKRYRVCLREHELNVAAAPQIYLGVSPVTREPDGSLLLGGSGMPVEWAVHMRRFPQENVLSERAAHGRISMAHVRALAGVIAASHFSAPVAHGISGAEAMRRLVDELEEVFAGLPKCFEPAEVKPLIYDLRSELDRISPLLEERAQQGWMRRCHGDLHLANIVLIDDKPVLFDALEFDEVLATTDVLYDLAFLIMDLWEHDLRHDANLLLNLYLFHMGETDHYHGLAALPLFLAIRAGIRAMVAAQRAEQEDEPERSRKEARHYFSFAARFLEPVPPHLVAVGGLSGTGKSTLAARIACHMGRVPGAVHLRSDLERKQLFGVEETHRLGAEGYSQTASERTYARVYEKAELALSSGHSVVADAVFSEPPQREPLAEIANRCGAPFTGFWLNAETEQLVERVAQRQGDASDATPDVVRRQLAGNSPPKDWTTINAGGSPVETLIEAERCLIDKGAIQFDEELALRQVLK